MMGCAPLKSVPVVVLYSFCGKNTESFRQKSTSDVLGEAYHAVARENTVQRGRTLLIPVVWESQGEFERPGGSANLTGSNHSESRGGSSSTPCC
jgi:hypothetical protein